MAIGTVLAGCLIDRPEAGARIVAVVGLASATTGICIFQQVGGALGTAVLAVILERSAAPVPSVDGLAHAFAITSARVLGLTVLSFVPALLLPGRAHRSP